MIRILATAALAALLHFSASQASFAQTAPAQVKERQEAMGKLWPDYYQGIARTVRTDSPDMALISATAPKAIAQLKKLVTLFPAGTGRDAVPATRAKLEIWTSARGI